jgi:hypothetical protein
MRHYFLPPLFNSLIWSAFSLALALPLIRTVHSLFNLENPPFNGLVLLGCGIIICFMGAAIIGAICGSFSVRNNGSIKWLAAFLGLSWSLATALWMLPTYAGMVIDDLARQSAVVVLNERGSIVPGTKSAVEAFQTGKLNEETRKNGVKIFSHSKEIALQGVSRLPAILMFGFALIGTPLVAFWECRRVLRV